MSAAKSARHVAVIGAGWAGCAAAIELTRAGCKVSLFEAARELGGRARGLSIREHRLDNGQHILLGAYRETLRLLQETGIDAKAVLLRLPLQIRYPAACDGMQLMAAPLPAPLHLAAGLLRASGLNHADRMAMLRFSTTARWIGWRLHQDCTVDELLERFDQTERLCQLMWRPLCVSALSTPSHRASAQLFLNVLRDSLGARRKASDMLIPRVDLGALLPQGTARRLAQAGGELHSGEAVGQIVRQQNGWSLSLRSGEESAAPFDAVVVATHAPEAARLLKDQLDTSAIEALAHENITTCYLAYAPEQKLDAPLYALREDGASGAWGQFVFDRSWTNPAQAGVFAAVTSASDEAVSAGHEALSSGIAAQLAAAFQNRALAQPLWTQVVTEKRAAISCTPGLKRPAVDCGVPGLALAGDYTESDYPSTIETAVRSGIAAAKLLMRA
jgi:hydroxysqualene dehydroxylase